MFPRFAFHLFRKSFRKIVLGLQLFHSQKKNYTFSKEQYQQHQDYTEHNFLVPFVLKIEQKTILTNNISQTGNVKLRVGSMIKENKVTF